MVARTPFLPMEEDERNAFRDYKFPEAEPFRIWLRGEYLLWRVSNENLPTPLVTTSTAPNSIDDGGFLGQAHTRILLGDQSVGLGNLPGARIAMGIGPEFMPPVEIIGYFVNGGMTLFNGTSDGSANAPVITRPIVVEQLPRVNGFAVEGGFSYGFPGLTAGSLNVTSTFNLWGIEPTLWLPLCASDALFINAMVGYKYADLSEDLTFTGTLRSANQLIVIDFGGNPNGFGQGFTTLAFDQFRTRNQFNGGNLGLRAGLGFGRLGVMVDTKLALGDNHEKLDVAGSSTLFGPLSSVQSSPSLPGGVLALRSNSGIFSRDEFTVIPEVGVNISFTVHENIRLVVGFNWMWWSSVVRPGDQLTNVIDSRQAPTHTFYNPSAATPVPGPSFNQTSLSIFGLNAGLVIGW
jgi:hypothetical protein